MSPNPIPMEALGHAVGRELTLDAMSSIAWREGGLDAPWHYATQIYFAYRNKYRNVNI